MYKNVSDHVMLNSLNFVECEIFNDTSLKTFCDILRSDISLDTFKQSKEPNEYNMTRSFAKQFIEMKRYTAKMFQIDSIDFSYSIDFGNEFGVTKYDHDRNNEADYKTMTQIKIDHSPARTQKFSILSFCVYQGNIECFDLILEHGVTHDFLANFRDNDLTLLHIAAYSNNDLMMKKLLDIDCFHLHLHDITWLIPQNNVFASSNTLSPLAIATMYRKRETMKLLLEFGAGDQEYEMLGYSSIWYAINNGDFDAVSDFCSICKSALNVPDAKFIFTPHRHYSMLQYAVKKHGIFSIIALKIALNELF